MSTGSPKHESSEAHSSLCDVSNGLPLVSHPPLQRPVSDILDRRFAVVASCRGEDRPLALEILVATEPQIETTLRRA